MENYDYDTTVSISDVRREMMKTAKDQQDQIDALTQRLADTKNTIDNISTARNFSGISNILDNSLPEWSKIAYDTLGVNPSDAGDPNNEAKNWYRQLASDTLLDPSGVPAPNAIATTAHSLYSTTNLDIPLWNKPNAWFEIGGVTQKWDVYYPIPNDIIFPGQRFTLQLEAMLRDTTPLPSGMQFYGGFYDNSAGQRKFIEGGNFTITDVDGHDPGIPFGIQTGTTSVDYQVLARTDSGEEAISNILNFPNCTYPFSQSNHPRIRFSGVPGFIEFEIFRKIGSSYVLQRTIRNSIEGTYFDTGDLPEANVTGFPSVTETAPRAFALTTNFQAGTPMGLAFIRNALTILVPTTYNRSLTGAGMQYLRMGLTLNTAIARQIYIRRIGLSMGDGNWARSAFDTQTGVHSTPSGSAATGSPSGGGSGGGGDTGGGGVEPPAPPGGGHCVLVDTNITLDKGQILLKDLAKARALGRRIDGGGATYQPIKGVRLGHTNRILRIATENRLEIGCTDGEPFITGKGDSYGTSAAELKQRFDRGERVVVLTKPEDEIVPAWVVSIREEIGDFTVGDPTVIGGLYIGNGFLLHNKPILMDASNA